MNGESGQNPYPARQALKRMIEVQRPAAVQLSVFIIIAGLCYFVFGTWPAVAIILGSLYLHELGHWIAFRANGVRACIIVLLPYGAATIPVDNEEFNRLNALPWWNICLTLLAGPLVNTLLVVAAHMFAGSGWITYFLFMNGFLNLSNLIPLSVTDGGVLAAYVFQSMRQPVRYWLSNIGVFTVLIVILGILINAPSSDISWWQLSIIVGYLLAFALGLYKKRYPVAMLSESDTKLNAIQMRVVGLSYLSMLVLTVMLMMSGPLP